VDAAGEAAILRLPQQPHARELAGNQVGAAVARRVVHHDDLMGTVAQRVQAAHDRITRVPIHNQNRDLSRHHASALDSVSSMENEPSVLRAWMVPWSSAISRRTSGRPTPMPPWDSFGVSSVAGSAASRLSICDTGAIAISSSAGPPPSRGRVALAICTVA